MKAHIFELQRKTWRHYWSSWLSTQLTVRLLKSGLPRQWKPIRRQNWNNRFQHFQIQPIKWGLCKVRTGWRRMADGGWRMADRKMRMIKCGWKIADDKMRMEKCGWQNADDKMRMTKCGWTIANDTMQMIKSLWGKISLRCFLKVLFVNKPSYIIEVKSGEVQYFVFNPKQFKTC